MRIILVYTDPTNRSAEEMRALQVQGDWRSRAEGAAVVGHRRVVLAPIRCGGCCLIRHSLVSTPPSCGRLFKLMYGLYAAVDDHDDHDPFRDGDTVHSCTFLSPWLAYLTSATSARIYPGVALATTADADAFGTRRPCSSRSRYVKYPRIVRSGAREASCQRATLAGVKRSSISIPGLNGFSKTCPWGGERCGVCFWVWARGGFPRVLPCVEICAL